MTKMMNPSPKRPPFREMIVMAIGDHKGGASRHAILKFIMSKFTKDLNPKVVNARIKVTMRSMLSKGELARASKTKKSNGSAGSFIIGPKAAKKETGPAKRVSETKKVKSTKAAGTKKVTSKAVTKKAAPKPVAEKKPLMPPKKGRPVSRRKPSPTKKARKSITSKKSPTTIRKRSTKESTTKK